MGNKINKSEQEGEQLNENAIIATVLIVTLIVVVVIVIIILVFTTSYGNDKETNVGQIVINDNCKNNFSQPQKKIPDLKGIQDEYKATINTKPVINVMNTDPEAISKKWDPNKNFPENNDIERPIDSFGYTFGPSKLETDLYLPTKEELFDSKSHLTGPKHIRRGPRYKRDGDWRQIMIPEDYKDWDKVRRPNRPRINEKYFEEAIKMEKEFYEENK